MSRSKLNYKVYNGKSLKILFENSRIMMFTVIFSTGILIGAFMLKNSEITEKISNYVNNSILFKSGQGIYDIFMNSFISNAIFLAVNIFLGFSLIGYTLIIWVPFLKGLGLGVVFGHLYSLYGLSGFGYSILTLFPGAVVSTFALITACNVSSEYSKNAYLKAITGKGQFEKGETKYFLLKQIIYICICVASSLIDTLFAVLFLRFFEF